ncbi:HET-domain-containing protein [Xylariomycetidae sp. FL0641]|nr:HET-domain-containing protein [Xylariomycetidae sp. FL0641]
MRNTPSLPEGFDPRMIIEEAVDRVAEKCIKLLGDDGFVSDENIKKTVTRTNVCWVLRGCNVDESEPLIDHVLHKARRIFLTLLVTNNISMLPDLVAEGLQDGDLPLKRDDEFVVRTLDEMANRCKEKQWKTFTNRHRSSCARDFIREQWRFLAPRFDAKFYQCFDQKRPLPFVELDESPHRGGHFGSVYRVRIHKAHGDPGIFRDDWVALKVFKPSPEDHFGREREVLSAIKGLGHDHLIKPIAAFESGEKKCFLFPWAEGGNLRDYWKKTDDLTSSSSEDNDGFMLWTLEQMHGLCHCLQLLWDNNCRHGDLKPANILHSGGRGNFLIADVGLSKIHEVPTEMRDKGSSTRFGTRRYEAPEVYSDEPGQPLSRDYDTWSMGALLYDWIVWLLYGYRGLSQSEKTITQFWQVTKGQYTIGSAAQDKLNGMKRTVRKDTALEDILLLIEKRLLVVERVRDGGIPEKGRAKARELCRHMQRITGRAKHDAAYRFRPETRFDTKPRHRSPTLVPPGRSPPPDGTRSLPGITRSNSATIANGMNVPTITVDTVAEAAGIAVDAVAEEVDTLQGKSLPRDEYSERHLNRLRDVWETGADNDLARKILRHLDWSALRPPQTTSLCSSCRGLDVWATGFALSYDMHLLESRRRVCDLCKLLHQSLLDSGLDPDDKGKLVRTGSALSRLPLKGAPVISLYSDPDNQTNPSPFSQIGLPWLPDPGSLQQTKVLREWLRNCDEAHQCHHPSSRNRQQKLPTRLIYVGKNSSSNLRLVETEGLSFVKYIALSHRWGHVPDLLDFSTSRLNFEERKVGIEFGKLPRTFRDAVKVTRSLEVEYLWIDSLCVIQKDQHDWEIEAGNMENVFSSAFCTIAASSARSCSEGFIHKREARPAVAMQRNGATLYFCKAIDDFRTDVEEAELNSRGWVLQERALSPRTIHFGPNQVYFECGEGVHCETLAKLRNPTAEILGDADFPKCALDYYRDGRIVLFQKLYAMYSKLDFTQPSDRSMGILGLERRLARTYETEGDFGVFKRYLQRSLLWKREGDGSLSPIQYPDERAIPSWSWMAYAGGIAYAEAPFGGVDWNENTCVDFETDPLRHATRMRAQKPSPEIIAEVRDFNTGDQTSEIRELLTFDEIGIKDIASLRCVVLGVDKKDNRQSREPTHYVLVVELLSTERLGVYRRVGVGSLPGWHISPSTGERIRIH